MPYTIVVPFKCFIFENISAYIQLVAWLIIQIDWY
jgi:hypothetical protein